MISERTGQFIRFVHGGSFFISSQKAKDAIRFKPKPRKILDLKMALKSNNTFGLSWTAPGAMLNIGTGENLAWIFLKFSLIKSFLFLKPIPIKSFVQWTGKKSLGMMLLKMRISRSLKVKMGICLIHLRLEPLSLLRSRLHGSIKISGVKSRQRIR